jgi:putative membrane protein
MTGAAAVNGAVPGGCGSAVAGYAVVRSRRWCWRGGGCHLRGIPALGQIADIIFMVTWFAGLFYLPRLFVYHALSIGAPSGIESAERFKVMERKLYYGIMTPGAIATIGFGLWLWSPGFPMRAVDACEARRRRLIGYHVWCGRLVREFQRDRNRHGTYGIAGSTSFPVLILAGAVILVVVKPFCRARPLDCQNAAQRSRPLLVLVAVGARDIWSPAGARPARSWCRPRSPPVLAHHEAKAVQGPDPTGRRADADT